jgi:hypothetical protein
MFTSNARSSTAAEQRVLATPASFAPPSQHDGDELMKELQLIQDRRDALMLARENVRFLLPQDALAQGKAAWHGLHQAIDQLQHTVKKLSSSPLLHPGNPLSLPPGVVASLQVVAPGHLASTVCTRYSAGVPAIVAAARSANSAEFRRSIQALMLLPVGIDAIARLVAQLEALAGRPEAFVKPSWFSRQPPGTYPPKIRDDIHQLLKHLTPVHDAMTSPNGPIQQLIAFAKAAQVYPEEIAAIVRQHGV